MNSGVGGFDTLNLAHFISRKLVKMFNFFEFGISDQFDRAFHHQALLFGKFRFSGVRSSDFPLRRASVQRDFLLVPYDFKAQMMVFSGLSLTPISVSHDIGCDSIGFWLMRKNRSSSVLH
jgi:hypothetical protein